MLTAATRANADSEWYIKDFKGMLGPYRLDQKTWTEAEATEKGLYSATIKPFTPKPTPGEGYKLGIATVVDGRVVWPVVAKSEEELAVDELALKTAELAACQCAYNGNCFLVPVVDELISLGVIVLSEMTDQVFVSKYNQVKQLQADIDGAA